jgi:hypothetical protein
MSIAKAKTEDAFQIALLSSAPQKEATRAGGVFHVQCFDKDGNLKWEERNHNLVVNEGLQSMVSVYLDAATQITTWYIGLVEGPGSGTTYSGTQTLASHGTTGGGGWTELTPGTAYTGNRKTATFGTATTADPSVIDNSASPADFAILGTYTVAGAFLASVATGTSGVLFSASDFTGGDRSVISGDTVRVTYTFSLDAA